MNQEETPAYFEYNKNHVDLIFGQEKSAVWLFDKQVKDEVLQADFKKASDSKTLPFITSGIQEDEQKHAAQLAGLEEKDLPAILIITPFSKGSAVFMFKKALSDTKAPDLVAFAKDFTDHKLTAEKRCAPIPATNPGPVFEVVRKTWKNLVLDEANDVFVLFYRGNDSESTEARTALAQLGAHVADAKNFKLAQIDLNANDIDDHE